MKLYLIKLFFPEKKKIVTSKVLNCPFLLSYVWSSQWSQLLQKAEGYNENRPCLTLMKPTQTICEGLYITGGNFERSKSSFVLVICACTSIKSTSRFCEDKPWSRGKPPQKWIFQNFDYGYVQTGPDEFSIGGKFVHLGVSFSWNHSKCTKIWTPKRSKIWTPKSRTNL